MTVKDRSVDMDDPFGSPPRHSFLNVVTEEGNWDKTLKCSEELSQRNEKPDMVNHPPHYKSESGIEVIDIIDDFVADPASYYKGNIIKYILRYEKKGGVEDLEKARWYLNRLIAHESVKE